MHEDLQRLNSYRLRKDLSFRALGELTGIPHRTLATLLTTPGAKPFDRTLFKIREFLNALPADDGADQKAGATR